MPKKALCDLKELTVEYAYYTPTNGLVPGYGYQFSVEAMGAKPVTFVIGQDDADEFADELMAAAAMIRAHAHKRR